MIDEESQRKNVPLGRAEATAKYMMRQGTIRTTAGTSVKSNCKVLRINLVFGDKTSRRTEPGLTSTRTFQVYDLIRNPLSTSALARKSSTDFTLYHADPAKTSFQK